MITIIVLIKYKTNRLAESCDKVKRKPPRKTSLKLNKNNKDDRKYFNIYA